MGIVLIIHSIINLTISLITLIIMYIDVKEASNPELRIKGGLFLLGMVIYFIGAIFQSLTALSIIAVLFFIPAIIFTYGGLIFPEWMKKIFLRDK